MKAHFFILTALMTNFAFAQQASPIVPEIQAATPTAPEKLKHAPQKLLKACSKGDLSMVKKLATKDFDPNAISRKTGNSLLILACNSKNAELVTFLLDKGANLHATNHLGLNALSFAIHADNTEIAKLLIKKGGALEYIYTNKNNESFTALSYACKFGSKEMVSLLLEHGANPNARLTRSYHKSPLGAAILRGDLPIVKLLVEKGARYDHKASGGTESPLVMASQAGQLEIVRYLVSQGANLYELSNTGSSLAIVVARSGNIKIMKYLVDNHLPLSDHLLIVAAAETGNKEMLKWLIDHKANLVWRDVALKNAASKGHLDVVKYILKTSPACLNDARHGTSALSNAIKAGNAEMVSYLLEQGAKCNESNMKKALQLVKSKSPRHRNVSSPKKKPAENNRESEKLYRHHMGAMPLSFKECVTEGYEDKAIELFLKEGNANQLYDTRRIERYHSGHIVGPSTKVSRLMLAAEGGMPRLLILLLEKGADINAKNSVGEDALLLAVRHNYVDIARILLEEGANIHSRDGSHRTPLLAAAQYASVNMVALLLEKGANIQDASDRGSALHNAVARNNLALIELLLSKGIKTDTKTKQGIMAKYFIRHVKAFELFQKHNLLTQEDLRGVLLSAIDSKNYALANALALQVKDFNPKVKTPNGREGILLQAAANSYSPDIELISTMLDKGAETNVLDEQGRNLLFTCNDEETVLLIISKGINVKQRAKNGETPLFNLNMRADAVKSMIEKGVDVNAANNVGLTALMRFVSFSEKSRDCSDIIQLLIKAGADVSAKDKNGKSVLQYANTDEVIKLLKSHGAK